MHLKVDMNSQDQNEKDFLRELSPLLFDHKQPSHDTPPEGYFNAFPDRMIAQIDKEKQRIESRRIPSYINFRNLSIAAGFALILALMPYFKTVLQINTGSTETTNSNNIAYVEIDSDLLANYIDTEDLYATVDLESNSISIPQPDTDSDVIIDYLMDEGISDQLFLESLNTDNR